MPWSTAVHGCQDKVVGKRKGWQLPTVEELASLVDVAQSPLTLPAAHPFAQVQPDAYWFATTAADLPSRALTVHFHTGAAIPIPKFITALLAWCVRGGQGHNGP
jgi:Protein of unknown function (DUF1566)